MKRDADRFSVGRRSRSPDPRSAFRGDRTYRRATPGTRTPRGSNNAPLLRGAFLSIAGAAAAIWRRPATATAEASRRRVFMLVRVSAMIPTNGHASTWNDSRDTTVSTNVRSFVSLAVCVHSRSEWIGRRTTRGILNTSPQLRIEYPVRNRGPLYSVS